MLIDTTKRARQEAEETRRAEKVAQKIALAAMFPEVFEVFDRRLIEAAKAGEEECFIRFYSDPETAGMAARISNIKLPANIVTLSRAYEAARPGIETTANDEDGYISFFWL